MLSERRATSRRAGGPRASQRSPEPMILHGGRFRPGPETSAGAPVHRWQASIPSCRKPRVACRTPREYPGEHTPQHPTSTASPAEPGHHPGSWILGLIRPRSEDEDDSLPRGFGQAWTRGAPDRRCGCRVCCLAQYRGAFRKEGRESGRLLSQQPQDHADQEQQRGPGDRPGAQGILDPRQTPTHRSQASRAAQVASRRSRRRVRQRGLAPAGPTSGVARAPAVAPGEPRGRRRAASGSDHRRTIAAAMRPASPIHRRPAAARSPARASPG